MTRLLLLCALAAACTTTYDYDPTSVGDAEGGDRAPRSKSSSQFLRGVYADLLGRTPQTYDFTLQVNGVTQFTLPLDEQAQLVTVLDGIGDPLPMRNLLVNGLLHSTEVAIPDKASVADPAAYVRKQFTGLLGRDPNVYELQAFTDAWARDPAVNPRTVIRAIVASREYQSQ
ncbi:MAG: hypothetical protein E6J90_11760 [Deltaproteobacteria bacterium]|nr:MAG: hypothetical protein E6J91_45240 [Deltaproteobacteria bacterium]TMQ22843.1 MAG: hypothetical protein E6J90_11760 [Deltaproteobacteria bacterium]